MTDLSRLPGLPYSPATPLEARFYRPPLPAGYVPRPRLCERLAAGLQGRLLLVCAPAGFGKSSLAIEFCEHLPHHWHSLWLGLSERERDPGRFLERLLLGLQQLYPGLGGEALGLLKMRQRHQPFAFEQWLDGLLDELAQVQDDTQPLLLVLDDYHLAQGAVLDRSLQFLLNHLPPGIVVLVTSRQRPDWHLARLRLSRQLLELSEQDLRLTRDELSALLASQGACFERQQVAAILQHSEGWVAGLRLWLLARDDCSSASCEPMPLHGGEGLIRDYLLEEVIERQPSDVQQFLLDTACLERFCAELCDAVRDSHDSAAIIRQLQANQVFLVPLDEQGRWFRYHHLFSDLLNARQHEATGHGRAGAHLRACRWFAAQGLLDASIEQALLAGQTDVAASLVQSLSEEQLLAEQNIAMLLRWKTNLPDSLLASSPRLILLYGWALALACQLDAAQELLDQLGRFLPAADPMTQRSLLAQWQALDGMIARGRGEGERAERQASEALSGLTSDRYGPLFMCLANLANLAVVRADLWRARGLNRDALELAQRVGNPLFEAIARYERARVLQARGEVQRALDEVHQGLHGLRGLSAQRSYSVRARLQIYEGYLHSLCLQSDAAREHLQRGVAEARSCRDVGVLMGYCVMASLEGRNGRSAEAFALLGEVERLMHVWDVPAIYYLAMVTLIKCELWLRQGQVELAAAWLPQLEATYGAQGRTTAPEFHPQLVLHIELQVAALERLQGDLGAAERRLRALVQHAQPMGGQLVGMMAQGQLALLLHQTGNAREAQHYLGACLESAQGGALLPFEELLQHQPHWLASQLREHPPGPVRDALLARLPCEATPEHASEVSAPAEKLSSRELAVLQLIARGCSNQQISERLFISLHTVKTHARHINSKLGVERRTQAVARAKVLGLLE
ncbi:Regulatory protein, LuxR [Pseudomonas sp. 8Z]|uniref:LuxR C-terminal-related transcriptional regulator n=1 Tax=Pseudomonas sp. 8Z TaxID=2653166 RepID=UPI0012F38BEF|nr:LuxR C-terminal-related transcriptional regulator [Pseudomonas sp. 8Z]VXC79076.1 Regulatory protein, LuxR [Pseudomonas sp. 8Z]